MWKLLACLALLLAVVSAQFTVRTTDTSIDVGTTSDPIYVETTTLPNKTITITIAAYNAVNLDPATITITPSTLQFGPNVQSQFFRVTGSNVGSFFFNFTKQDEDGQFADIADLPFVFQNRTFGFYQFDFDTPLVLTAGLPSEPLTVYVSTAPTSDLRITPQTDDTTITFPSGPAIIRAGTLSGTFTVEGRNAANNLRCNMSFAVEGDSNNFYDRDSIGINQPAIFQINPRQFTVRGSDVDIQLGSVNSTGISVFTRDVANNSFTITPKAAGVTFSPADATFNANQPSAFFTFTTDQNEVTSDRVVNFYSSGQDSALYTLNLNSVTFSAPKRIVRATIGGQNVVANKTYMSVSIRSPVKTSLVVSFSASNIQFNVSSVEFKNNITSFTVEVRNTNLGSDYVFFALSGADAQLFAELAPLSVTSIIRGNFIGPANWYIPALWVGVESDKIPIRASISPRSTVTLTPVASNVIFRPASLTFRNGTEQQYFTITPLYTSQSDSYTASVTWFINGTDHTLFDLPTAFTIGVNARTFQAKGSNHLKTAELDSQNIAGTRHLHKTYKIWTSVNYIGAREHFSVTPTSPYYSFKPAVLFFNNKNTRIVLEATVTGVPASGAGRIDYIYGGQDGGLYVPTSPDTTAIALRPLEIVAAVVAPDERSKGVFLVRNYTGPTHIGTGYDPVIAGALTSYHVQSFKIRSFVLPDKSLTITPHCAHAEFSPKSITIKGDDGVKQQDWWPTVVGVEGYQVCTTSGCTNLVRQRNYEFNVTGVYLEANFSVKALASGTHNVWFELSGDDKDYYKRVSHTAMNFNLVMRPKSEPYRVSSSSYLLPSFVVVAAMAVLSLVM